METIALSLCISTFKRAKFIPETLDSIVGQLLPGVEVVIIDGCSPDETPSAVASYVERYPQIRYYREAENGGVDRDYDKSVSCASGKYCWLMTDDDLLRPGAVGKVLAALEGAGELVVVNAEVRNADFSKLIDPSRLRFDTDRTYTDKEREAFFRDCIAYLTFIGSVVIGREVWLARDRSSYYGTEFVHLGVIFQRPPLREVRVIAEPLITIRYGNALWSPRAFEVFAIKFPGIVWSLPELSDETRNAATPREPWRSLKGLFLWRAKGAYSRAVFDKYLRGKCGGLFAASAYAVGIVPGWAANIIAILYFGMRKHKEKLQALELANSGHWNPISRELARMLRILEI